MTHNELLMLLWDKRNSLCDNLDVHFALTAVAELHKPVFTKVLGEVCDQCSTPVQGIYSLYPCPTIQAIEKELV